MNHVESYVLRDLHPVDVIEHVAHRNEWSFERDGDDELSIEVAGVWADYHVSFSWLEDVEALHLLCAFDLKVPKRRMQEMIRLIAMVNEQLLLGHFDLWEREGAVMYRQALLLSGGVEPTGRQVEALLNGALQACECYYQAFQFVVGSQIMARDALSGVLFETHGTA